MSVEHLTKETVLAIALLLSGCTHPMSNDEIIAETKKCADAGMDTRELMHGLTFEIIKVQCRQKEQSK